MKDIVILLEMLNFFRYVLIDYGLNKDVLLHMVYLMESYLN